MSTFDKKKLRMLSPDAEDWNGLVTDYNYNYENSVIGVLLYPRKGIRKKTCLREVEDEILDQKPFCHGCYETQIKQRGQDWAVIYKIDAWYNHFDLNEEYD